MPSSNDMTRPSLTLEELRGILRDNAHLPKSRLSASQYALALNPFRYRDRKIERVLLRALVDPISTADENAQALAQANCWPGHYCGEWSCFLCRQRLWLVRRDLAEELSRGLTRDDISWCTIIAGVTHRGSGEAENIIATAKARFTAMSDRWPELKWLGRFEADYLFPGARSLGTWKLSSLVNLGYDPADEAGALVPHSHSLLFHPGVQRGFLVISAKRAFPGSRRVDIHPLRGYRSIRQNLDNLVRYSLKCLPPKETLPGRGSRYHKPRQISHLRYFNRVMRTLGGLDGILNFDSSL